ncbi:hypothetical protein O181_053377 [Austropuccinia psidii MF-1]|uniref:Integrase zinc-binding domain-containing protein n=1 Tax=Austropuccinia psidii MF-1 TaxID=1389203 RepID=A0A9Q3E9J3_9BASI|nr:hypothetical protein [Austropuccinia psidii MF-1]
MTLCRRLLINTIIHEFHDSIYSGHLSEERTLEKVKNCAWWPFWRKKPIEYCHTCDRCQNAKRSTGKKFGLMIHIQEPNSPWEVVHMDWVTALPARGDKNYNCCLVILDRYSKTPIFLPCHKDDTAMGTAPLLLSKIVWDLSQPLRITLLHWCCANSNLGPSWGQLATPYIYGQFGPFWFSMDFLAISPSPGLLWPQPSFMASSHILPSLASLANYHILHPQDSIFVLGLEVSLSPSPHHGLWANPFHWQFPGLNGLFGPFRPPIASTVRTPWSLVHRPRTAVRGPFRPLLAYSNEAKRGQSGEAHQPPRPGGSQTTIGPT